MRLSDLSYKKKKKTWITFIGAFIISLSVGLIFVFFPHLLANDTLINLQYFKNGNEPRVVSLYQEIGNSDDGSYLKGYWVKIADPKTNKVLDKIFVKRKDKYNNIPPTPNMYCIDNKEIWLVGDKGIYQGDVGYMAIININNDHLEMAPANFLDGWNISSSYIYNNTISVVNQYNEAGCLDMIKHTIKVPSCDNPQDSAVAPQSCFFFLKNTSSSTRSHLYFYQSTQPLAAPGIFVGYLQQGQTTPGWHLIDHIKMQYGSTLKEDMDAYIAQFDSTEKVTPVYTKEFLNSPYMIADKGDICVLSAFNDQGVTSFYQFTSNGKLVWKVECPKLNKQTAAYGFDCIYTQPETILIHHQNWVLSIDNNTGKVNWQYPK